MACAAIRFFLTPAFQSRSTFLISTIVTSRYAIDGTSTAALSRGGRGDWF